MYLSLHTADPLEYGLQATEVAYQGYERYCLDEIAFHWRGTNLVNQNHVIFPPFRIGRLPMDAVSHIAFIDEASGPGRIVKCVPLDSPLDPEEGVCPSLAPGALSLYAVADHNIFARVN